MEHLNQAQFILCCCTVHELTNHRNVVGEYVLLPKKRRATYVEMVTEAQQLTHNA